VTKTTLQNAIAGGGILTLMGVAQGSGLRMALDRDQDTIRDAQEVLPTPALAMAPGLTLRWPANSWGLVPERSENLIHWGLVTDEQLIIGSEVVLPLPPSANRGFYRLSRP
jgi:hypothetical protein